MPSPFCVPKTVATVAREWFDFIVPLRRSVSGGSPVTESNKQRGRWQFRSFVTPAIVTLELILILVSIMLVVAPVAGMSSLGAPPAGALSLAALTPSPTVRLFVRASAIPSATPLPLAEGDTR